MGETKIEWATTVWNPVTGCTKISAGCQNCYASRMATRLAGRYGYPNEEPFRLTVHPERLVEPFRWKKPRTVFVVSMGDLFHSDVPCDFIEAVFGVMSMLGRHTFVVLTKRPENAAEFFRKRTLLDCQSSAVFAADPSRKELAHKTDLAAINGDGRNRWPLPNVWIGTSAENQEQADKRIPHLLECPAALRFVSAEPLLGNVDLSPWLEIARDRESGRIVRSGWRPEIDWVIVGGESGPHARPCDVTWIRLIAKQCRDAGVPPFVKQLGTHVTDQNSTMACTFPESMCWPEGFRQDGNRIHLKHPKGADSSEWPADLRIRETPR